MKHEVEELKRKIKEENAVISKRVASEGVREGVCGE